MWGFSLEELAKRAQEEASRLAEQASHIQSPGLFNLDDMQSDDQEEEQVVETEPAENGNNINSADVQYSTPVKKQQSATAASIEEPTLIPKVTKLQVTAEDEVDDFNFDSWGEDEIDVTEDSQDNSDETAERMRQESQILAQQIMEEERRKEDERLRAEEEERKKQEEQELERIQKEELEKERLRRLEEARRLEEQQQRLEKEEEERRVAEEARVVEEERLRKVREEEEERLRLEEEAKLLEEQKRLQERQAQEEAQRLQEEKEQEQLRLEAEREAKLLEEEEARAEKERLLREEEENEKERQLEEQKRLERERKALEAARAEQERARQLQEQEEREARLLEEKLLEDQRQAEKIAEEEKIKTAEKEEEERKQERLRLEEDEEQQRLEQEAMDVAKKEDSVLEDEMNHEINGEGWSDHEEGEQDYETSSAEIVKGESAQCHDKVEEQESKNVLETDLGDELADLPDVVEHPDELEEVAKLDSESLQARDSIVSIDARDSDRAGDSNENSAQENRAASPVENPIERKLFGVAAAADLASSMFDNQASNLFTEATKSASMFSWGQSPESTTNGEVEAKDKPNTEDDLYSDDLDAMYDDGESDDESDYSETQVETQTHELATVQNDDNDEVVDSEIKNEDRIPPTSAQHTVEDFVKQLERMSESHQLEMSEMQRSHQVEIERLQNELSLERDKKEKEKSRKEVASQDKFLSQMRELEKKFNTNLKEKDDELQQVMLRNEGMRLKMDSMKREVDGLIKLVDERDDEIAALKQGHGKSMVQVEGKVKDSEEELARKDAEISRLRASESSLKADLDSTTEAYHTLKERAKSVATELKDRRVEVRTLTSKNQEISSSKTLLETQLTNLRAVVNQHELTIGYKDKDMEALSAKVKELEKQIEGKEKSIQDSSAVGEKAIASYKRKAQEALAAANSRLALSNQAREEAESEAKAAKSTADDAVKRARDAESKMAEAEQRASAATTLLDELKLSSHDEINTLKETVDSLKSTIDSMQAEAEEDSDEREKLNLEIGQLRTNLVEVKKRESELREKLKEQQALCTSLQREVHDLNDEVQRNSAAAFKRANDEVSHSDTDRNLSLLSLDANGSAKAGDRQEADGTILMLQQELRGANEAIADLKLALRTALLEKADGESRDKISETSNEVYDSDSPHGNDSSPLFYAIEKQNELNTARDEINRLANMLGDAEAEKQDAYDTMEEMRLKMEEANARLLRYERLGLKSARPHQNVSQPSYGPFRNTSQSLGIATDNNLLSSGNDSVVNLEYLKNVMLSYLKAKTLADRRKLVPVIATVLCLTPEEQAQAVSSVEESAGLSGVAVSFWENLESKAHNLM